MLTELGLCLDRIQDSNQVVGCGIESSLGSRVQRDVEMDPPLGQGNSRSGCRGGQCIVEISMPNEGAVGPSFDDLMEINVFGEGLERLADLSRRTYAECVAQMDLAQPDTRGLQPCQGLGRSLVLDGQVAAVVVDAQMTVDAPVSGA